MSKKYFKAFNKKGVGYRMVEFGRNSSGPTLCWTVSSRLVRTVVFAYCQGRVLTFDHFHNKNVFFLFREILLHKVMIHSLTYNIQFLFLYYI